MSKKMIVMGGMIVGSYAGGFIPALWGDTSISAGTVLFTAIGGFVGIWVTYMIARNL